MTAQKATKQPHKKRKTGYQKSFDKQAYIACAEGGFTNEQLRKLFNVKQYKTIWNWRNANPSFDEAITRGKDEFNQDKAEQALLKRVLGFSYDEIIYERRKVFETVMINGKKYKNLVGTEMVETKRVTKYMPPDVGALAFYLKCRDKERWREPNRLDISSENKDGLTIIVKHEK